MNFERFRIAKHSETLETNRMSARHALPLDSLQIYDAETRAYCNYPDCCTIIFLTGCKVMRNQEFAHLLTFDI